jgi:hypothetical protein
MRDGQMRFVVSVACLVWTLLLAGMIYGAREPEKFYRLAFTRKDKIHVLDVKGGRETVDFVAGILRKSGYPTTVETR